MKYKNFIFVAEERKNLQRLRGGASCNLIFNGGVPQGSIPGPISLNFNVHTYAYSAVLLFYTKRRQRHQSVH